MNLYQKHYKTKQLVTILTVVMFLVTSSLLIYVAKDGLEYSKASSIHAQTVLP